MKRNEDDILRAQINALIRDEIQDTVNEYIEDKEVKEKKKKEPGMGFAIDTMDEEYFKEEEKTVKELKVNVPNDEVDRILKEYKRIKKRQRSNLNQIKLLDKHGKPLK